MRTNANAACCPHSLPLHGSLSEAHWQGQRDYCMRMRWKTLSHPLRPTDVGCAKERGGRVHTYGAGNQHTEGDSQNEIKGDGNGVTRGCAKAMPTPNVGNKQQKEVSCCHSSEESQRHSKQAICHSIYNPQGIYTSVTSPEHERQSKNCCSNIKISPINGARQS